MLEFFKEFITNKVALVVLIAIIIHLTILYINARRSRRLAKLAFEELTIQMRNSEKRVETLLQKAAQNRKELRTSLEKFTRATQKMSEDVKKTENPT